MKDAKQPMTWSLGDHIMMSKIIAICGLKQTTTWSIGHYGAKTVDC